MQKRRVMPAGIMRSLLWALIVLAGTGPAVLYGSDSADYPVFLEKNHIEFGYGHYTLEDSRYRKVYSQGREIYSLELSRLILANTHHHLAITIGVRGFKKKGQATFTGEPTVLSIYPVTLGFRYYLSLGGLIPWLEIGMDHYSYKEKSDIRPTRGSSFGYHIQRGLYIRIPWIKPLKLKIAVKHTKVSALENGIKINLGGFEYYVGLAFGFNCI